MRQIGVLMAALTAASVCMAEDAGLETVRWQTAIDVASRRGGGVVSVPAGRHVVGQLYLKSNVELRLERGASLEGAAGLHNYRVHKLPFSEGTWSAVVMGLNVTNVAITGEGEIFGNGKAFEPVKAYGVCAEGFRPRGVFFSECRGIRLEDFTLRDAACWGIVLKCCDGMTARRVKIDSHANHNNDGFDVEAKNVLIEDCDVDAGDDAYCIKSNNPDFVVENVTVRNCIARSHCNGYKLGTASHGTMRGIRVERCRTAAPRRVYRDLAPMPRDLTKWYPVAGAPKYLCGPGIGAVCVECVDGVVVEDVFFDDIQVAGFQVPVFVRGGTRSGRACGTPPNDKYVLRNVIVQNVRGRAEQAFASSVTGVKGCRPADVTLRNFDIECVGEGETAKAIREPGAETAGLYPEATMFRKYRLPAYGLYVDQADGVRVENLRFTLRPGTVDGRQPIHFSKDVTSK